MGSIHFLSPSPLYHIFISKTLLHPNSSSNLRSFSSSKPNRRFNYGAFQSRRSEFEDEFDFDFNRRDKRRNWWSDDGDGDDDVEFGLWDEPATAIDWVFKILKAFGWMVPAIMLSSYVSPLLGTGSNSLIMALVLPLGQTALSIVMDKLWGGPSSNPNFRPQGRPRSKSRSRSRSRRKRSPYTGTANPGIGGARVERSRPCPVNGGYHSWGPAKNGVRGGSKFGGWDELDQEVASNNSFPGEQRQKVDALQREYAETGKLSRMINRDKPLFLRLLIAVFPFLGSWTRFFF